MKKGREIVISGSKVCGVGYRPFLLLTALSLGIEKVYAYNDFGPGTEKVIIHLYSDESRLNSYVDVIKSSTPEHASVDLVEERDYQGEVMDAGVYLQFLQFEQINKAVPAILSIDKKQSAMLEKQDAMLEKQDETISILKYVKDDTSAIRNDITEIKKDAKDSILEKYFELSREIAEIKATLSDIKAKVS